MKKHKKSQMHQEMAETLNSAKMISNVIEKNMLIVKGLLKCDMAENARRIADDMKEKNPKDWRGSYAIGLVDRHEGKLAEAVVCMQQASKLNPKAYQPLLETAWILIQAKKTEAAVDMGRKAVAVNPRSPDLRRALAKVLRAAGQVEQALEEEELANTVSKRQDATSLFD
jgi:tetratricopeptide (TPR) repeat protein